jgi:hypothetical protein
MGGTVMIVKASLALPAALALLALGGAAGAGVAAPEASHTFVLTYRNFGPVTSAGPFKPGDGYAVRSEGCYAKHSEEAICGFTLRATRALTITNLGNAAHATGADGSVLRTCCMFVQGDTQGYPITKSATAPADIAVLSHALKPGQTVGLMLRVPGYKQAAQLAGVTFSRGQGDLGVAFAATVTELP